MNSVMQKYNDTEKPDADLKNVQIIGVGLFLDHIILNFGKDILVD